MKQVFHCEKEELVASSPRAAQGAFLRPLLGWKMATDVRYCETSQNVNFERTLEGLNSSNKEWSERAGAQTVTLCSVH